MENCNLNNSLESDSDSDSGSFLVLGRKSKFFFVKNYAADGWRENTDYLYVPASTMKWVLKIECPNTACNRIVSKCNFLTKILVA